MQSDNVAVLVKKAALEFDKIANPILQTYGLTSAQYKILKYLFANRDAPVRQVDLERYYSLTHPTTIGLLEQLEKKGFIQRQINPADGRSRIVTLTERSLAIQSGLDQAGKRLERELTAALTGEERLALVELLQKLLSAFQTS